MVNSVQQEESEGFIMRKKKDSCQSDMGVTTDFF